MVSAEVQWKAGGARQEVGRDISREFSREAGPGRGTLVLASLQAALVVRRGALLELREVAAVQPQRVVHLLPHLDEKGVVLAGLKVEAHVRLQPPLHVALKAGSPFAVAVGKPGPPVRGEVDRLLVLRGVLAVGAQLGRQLPREAFVSRRDGACRLHRVDRVR